MSQHAVLSPSGAEKWMNCSGAPAMEQGLPDSATDYSDHGTAAHLLGSVCLEQGKHPLEFEGRRIVVGLTDVFDGAAFEGEQDPRFVVRRTYPVDEEMVAAIGRYVDRVREYVGTGILLAEQRLSISSFTGEAGAAGTADATGILPDELQVHDLKYGMGVKVFAKRNKQLMIYALGVRESVELTYGPFKKIRLVIHQPRLEHLDEWDCTSEELDAFAEEVKVAADKALFIYENPGLLSAVELNPSDDACRWCKAKPTCPKLAKFVADSAAMDFEAIDAAPQIPGGSVILAQKMAAIPLIEDWCKAIRAKVESELFAGVAIPGWKLVQGKRGNRSWKDVEAADALLKLMRMPMEDRYKMTLLSPTQIERALKPTPKRLQRVLDAKLVEQRDGLPSVAPESDPRPVWAPPDQAKDFTVAPESVVPLNAA